MFTCTAGLTASGQPCPNGSYCPTGEVPIEYKDIPDTGCEKICPSDDSNEIASTGDRKEITDCQTTRTGVDLNDGTGGGDQICKYVAQHQDPTKIGYTNCESVKIKYCNAGRYRVQTDSPTCAPVTAGFWSPAKSSTDDPISVARYSCNLLGVDGATTSGANAETSSSPTACQITCPDVNITDANNETIGVRHANPTTVNFSGTYNYSNGTVSGGYPTCTYDAPDCYPGYHTNGNTCEPNVYTFTLDKNGGTSGDNGPIYMKYYTGWYWDADATNPIETVNLPVQGDQNCSGYEVTIGATTTTIIDETGHIIVSNHYGDGSLPTDSSITLTASWTPKQGIQCQPGYYFSHTADNGAGACAPCPNGSWCPGGYAYNGPDNQGSDLYITACPSDSTKYTPAQTFNGTTLVDVAPDIGSDGQRSAESDCYATVKYVPSVDPRGAGSRVCHYAAGQYATNCNDVQILTCDSGYWLDTTKSTTNCSKAELQYYSGQYLTTRTRCPNAQYAVSDSRNTIETDNDESGAVDACFQVGIWERTEHGGHTKRCHWNTSNDTYSINCGSSYVMRKCDGGYWDALEGAATDNEYIDCVPVGATYYSPAPANWDATTTTDTTSTTRQECPSGVGAQNVESTTASTTGTAATAKTDCYLTCKATITMSGTTSNVKNPDGRAYFDETQNGYELCLYDKCPAGMWCDENGLHNCPTDKDGNPGVADFDGEELRSIDKCYVTYNPYAATAGYPNHGWENGTGWATCFFLGDESTGDYSNCMNADALTCNAGYWYKVPGAFACSAVTNGYYSANGAITQTECPVGWAGSINEPANNNPAATYAACYKTCDAGTGDFAHSKTVNKASATVNAKSATEYNDCLYTIAECDTGYTPMGANTANPWCQPNTYTITLNKNGGMGTTAASVQCTFDSGQCALPAIVDTRDGYSTANKWCTTADGSGTCYDAGTTVTTNISATGTDTELFAKWTPNVYEITLNNNGALSAGAPGTVYLKYATGWYSNSATTRTITEMETLPTNGAQKFTGYKSAGDNGIMVIDSMGRFITTNPGALTFTTSNTTVTAQWADAPITCPEGTYYVGTGVDPNDENVCKACEENHYCGGTETQTNSGQSGLFECPDGGKSPAGSSDVSACYKELLPTYVATHGTGTQTCYYKEAASAYSDRCKDFAITACYAGYYRANTTDTDCTQVGVGNYSADAELVRHECPNGGTTAQDNKTAETVYECYKTNLGYAASDGTGTGTQSCWYSEGTGNSATYVRDCFDKVITACRGGYYRVNNDDIVCNVVDYNYYSIEGDIARHACPDDGKTSYQDTSTVAECWKNGQPYTAEHGGGERTCKWSVSDNTYLAGCGVPTMLYCDGGYYLANVATDTDCTMVGYAYYSPDRDLMRYSCATGQTTLTQTSDNANACFTCPANSVCAPGQGEKTCAELTGGQYTKSDVGTTDAAYCYKDCTMAENAGEMSGRDYYTADDTCAIAKCAEGYALLNGQCTICPEGSYCDGTPGDDGDGAKSCSDLGDGSWMYSDNGSTKASDCYRTCVEHMEGTCKLTPATGKAYWPNDCQYTGTSASGNPAEVINGVCVETECNSHYEMVNGTCEPCNRENALSYKPDGNCIVESCVMGYHPNGDKCEEDIVDCTENAPNATLAEQKWDAAREAYGVCMIKSCEADYHVASNACVANEQVCDIPNGVGTKTWNTVTKTWNPCIATSCVPGYTNDPSEKNNASEQCSECRNKFSVLGEVAVSSYSTGCEIASCMYQGEKYNLDNNECVPICTEGYSDETGYLHWNDRTKKCERNCYTDQGYMSW